MKNRIEEIRNERGIRQDELAKRMGLRKEHIACDAVAAFVLGTAAESVRRATEIISGTKSFAMSAMMAILPAEQGDVSAIVTNRSYPIRSPRLTPASSPFSRGFPWQAESRRHRQTVSNAASPRRKPFIHPFPLLN